MPYCVLSIKKYHTFPQIYALEQHNDRQIPLPNVDPSMSIHNVSLLSRGASYTDTWHEIVKDAETRYGHEIKCRSNSVLLMEVVTGFSRDTNIPNIMQWAEKNLEWMKKKFGEENIISCTLHMDETTPHIHTDIVPIDERGRLCAKSFTAGRYAMKKMHTEYSAEMKEFGLTRGFSASKSKKKNLDEFYKSVNKANKAVLPPRMNNEDEEEYLKRMEKYCKSMKMAYTKVSMMLEQSNAMIGTRIAQEFSRFSTAVSLYEDLYEKFNGDEELVNKRLTAYRKIENRTPAGALGGLLDNLLNKYEDRQTPLTNWSEKGKEALSDIQDKQDKGENDTETVFAAAPYYPEEEYVDDFLDNENGEDDGILDI